MMLPGIESTLCRKRNILCILAGLIGLVLTLLCSKESTIQKNPTLHTRRGNVNVLISTHDSHSGLPSRVDYETGWWTPFLNDTARTFYPWKGPKYGWCQPFYSRDEDLLPTPPEGVAPKGLQYIKTPKASSSTCAGVNAVIAHHVARRIEQERGISGENEYREEVFQCEHYEQHTFARSKAYHMRNQSDSLLWSFVRHPRLRDISQAYFFEVSRGGVSPNDTEYLIEIILGNRSKQTHYLTGTPQSKKDAKKIASRAVQTNLGGVAEYIQDHIFGVFDFIGVTERMLESLAVMTFLWDLDPTDVIALSSKVTGKEEYVQTADRQKCTVLQKASNLHPKIERVLNSKRYKNIQADFLLYYAANLSLDRTIEALGARRVQERSLLLQRLQQLADESCHDIAIFPCSSDGTRHVNTSCYVDDSGCGHECVDKVMEDYRLGRISLV